jgi:hypothetical protein
MDLIKSIYITLQKFLSKKGEYRSAACNVPPRPLTSRHPRNAPFVFPSIGSFLLSHERTAFEGAYARHGYFICMHYCLQEGSCLHPALLNQQAISEERGSSPEGVVSGTKTSLHSCGLPLHLVYTVRDTTGVHPASCLPSRVKSRRKSAGAVSSSSAGKFL